MQYNMDEPPAHSPEASAVTSYSFATRRASLFHQVQLGSTARLSSYVPGGTQPQSSFDDEDAQEWDELNQEEETWKVVLKHARPPAWPFSGSVAASIFVAILRLHGISILGQLTDSLAKVQQCPLELATCPCQRTWADPLAPDSESTTANSLLRLVAVCAADCILQHASIALLHVSSAASATRWRIATLRAATKQEVTFFDPLCPHTFSETLSAEASAISAALNENLPPILTGSSSVVIGCISILHTHALLSLLLVALLLFVGACSAMLSRAQKKLHASSSSSACSTAQSLAHGFLASVGRVCERDVDSVLQKYHAALEEGRYASGVQIWAAHAWAALAALGRHACVVLVLWAGGRRVATLGGNEEVTLGGTTSSVGGAVALYLVTWGVASDFRRAFRSISRLLAFDAAPCSRDLVTRRPRLPYERGVVPAGVLGTLAFEEVVVRYPSHPKVKVINAFSVEVPNGTSLAVVGGAGSGRSTVLAAVMRLQAVSAGRILIDGENISRFNPRWLRRNLGIIAQEPVLFDGTVEQNITLGATYPGYRHGVEKAAKSANAHDFIQCLPGKFQASCGAETKLSRDQKLRLAIARALYKKPKIMLIDECSHGVSGIVELYVEDALATARQGRTSIVVTNKASTTRAVDKIVVLKRGRIEELGTHDELMAAGGQYKQIVTREQPPSFHVGSTLNSVVLSRLRDHSWTEDLEIVAGAHPEPQELMEIAHKMQLLEEAMGACIEQIQSLCDIRSDDNEKRSKNVD